MSIFINKFPFPSVKTEAITMKWILIILAALAIIGCAQQEKSLPAQPQQYTIDQPGEQPSQTGQQYTIQIENFRFVPESITVTPGSEVTWVNSDSTEHTLTLESTGYDEMISSGGQATIMFETAGTYDYICRLHPNMRGTVIVN